jgi:hypothetical protein
MSCPAYSNGNLLKRANRISVDRNYTSPDSDTCCLSRGLLEDKDSILLNPQIGQRGSPVQERCRGESSGQCKAAPVLVAGLGLEPAKPKAYLSDSRPSEKTLF